MWDFNVPASDVERPQIPVDVGACQMEFDVDLYGGRCCLLCIWHHLAEPQLLGRPLNVEIKALRIAALSLNASVSV